MMDLGWRSRNSEGYNQLRYVPETRDLVGGNNACIPRLYTSTYYKRRQRQTMQEIQTKTKNQNRNRKKEAAMADTRQQTQ